MILKIEIFICIILLGALVQVLYPDGIMGLVIAIQDWLLELSMGY